MEEGLSATVAASCKELHYQAISSLLFFGQIEEPFIPTPSF